MASSPSKWDQNRNTYDSSPHRNLTSQSRTGGYGDRRGSDIGSKYSGSAYDVSQSKYGQDRSMVGSQYSGSQSYVQSRAYQDRNSNQWDYDEIQRR